MPSRPRLAAPILSPTSGWAPDIPPHLRDSRQASLVNNIRYRQGYLQKREGLSEIRTAPSARRVMFLPTLRYETGTVNILRHDTKLVYLLGSSNWSAIHPNAALPSGGTCWVESGTPTLFRGLGTDFVTDLAAGDFVKITSHAGDKWTEIDTVDSTTQCTLVENYRGATDVSPGAAASFIDLTDLFTGTTSQYTNGVVVLDKYLFGNGVDPMYVREEGNNIAKLTSLAGASGTPLPSRYVLAFASRAWLFYQQGATLLGNQIQWSAVGDIAKWATADGGGSLQLREDPFLITGASVRSGVMVVYKDRSLVLGRPTPDPDNPVDFSTLAPLGIGCIAPQSLVRTRDFDAFVGPDDFYIFRLGNPVPIGQNLVRQEFFKRLNWDKLDQVYGFADTNNQEIIWLVSEGSNTDPQHAFVYNWGTGSWMHDEYTIPRTAIGRFFEGNDETWSSITGSWSDYVGVTWGSFASAESQPLILVGHADGRTSQMLSSEFSDLTDPISCRQQTGVFAYVGAQITMRDGRPYVIQVDDMITVDQIDISYQDLQNDTTVNLDVSTDDGGTWNVFGNVVLAAGSGGDLTVSVHGQVTGRRISYRIRHNTTNDSFMIRDIIPYVYISGKV